ncbi:toxin biosynthesis protein [Histoplasma capsulatum var. duboisii H88]|uniref:Toxin biosynthesis protein n=2 Tax=Ajellomyces capsulatus (strain H88) TaxID=544711 RepID=F0U573_AJEC8|nr:toxin biosynthesis protein [Histoplasma capsulatum var. duboisii H88]
MISGPFCVIEHLSPCQHIREYPRAIATEQEETLWLSVKQYVPIDNPNPKPGDITIIGAHANGFPKELYEPLWEELLSRAKRHGFGIRGIWIADVAHQGNSGVLNENVLGNDPSWFDHPRDLLHFINLKREEMPRPIFGIGHSMGGNNLVNLSLLHPRLLTSLILLDPVIYRPEITPQDDIFHNKLESSTAPATTVASSYRRDIWPSRAAAAEAVKKSPFYQHWDPRVLDLWIKYGLRELPTALYPSPQSSSSSLSPTSPATHSENPVTLTTTRHQEVFTFSRPNFDPPNTRPINRLTHPDLAPGITYAFPFYRPEAALTFARLPHLRPSVLYVFADKSDMCLPHHCQAKLDNAGIGVGGSGGVADGRVKSVLLKDVGHLIPMEAVGETADHAAEWIGKEMQRWRREEGEFRREWEKKSKIEKATIDEEWRGHAKPPVRNNQSNGVGGAARVDAKL